MLLVGELRRRHSSANTTSGNNEEKVVPRYLRASTRSCHDFCKYGKQLALEPEKISLIPRISERAQLHRSSEKNIGEVVVEVTPDIKRRASTDSNSARMSMAKRRESTDSDSARISLAKRRESTDSDSARISLAKRRESTDSDSARISLAKRRESTDSNASNTIKIVKTEPGRPVQPDNEVVVVNKTKTSSVKVKQSPILPKSHFFSTFKTRRQEISSRSKLDITPKQISKRVGASSMSSSKKEQSLSTSIFQKAKVHPISTSYLARTPSKSTIKKMGKIASPLLPSSSSKSSRRRVVGTNMHKSLKTASRVKNQPKPKEVEPEEHCIEAEAEEKTLYVIEIENEENTFLSDQNGNQDIELYHSQSFSSSKFSSQEEDQEESEYAASEFKEDSCFASNREVNKESLETLDLKVEENQKPLKDEIVILVETQIEESGTKKLKSRRGKVLRENNADSDGEGEDVSGCDKVVLRHQDMKGKKDEQVLLNNVIEEGASQLVEIQRSKVKALVSAFETLISLNEKKH